MNPFLFYLLAERLANDAAGGPAEFRSAISRAYYAVFHRTREFLTELGIRSPAGPASHGKIPMALQALTDRDVKQAGKDLDALKGKRNRADYALTDAAFNQRATAQRIVAEAFQILGAIAACLGDAARKVQAEAELKSWAQSKTAALMGFAVV
jgi:hypothetical protein